MEKMKLNLEFDERTIKSFIEEIVTIEAYFLYKLLFTYFAHQAQEGENNSEIDFKDKVIVEIEESLKTLRERIYSIAQKKRIQNDFSDYLAIRIEEFKHEISLEINNSANNNIDRTDVFKSKLPTEHIFIKFFSRNSILLSLALYTCIKKNELLELNINEMLFAFTDGQGTLVDLYMEKINKIHDRHKVENDSDKYINTLFKLNESNIKEQVSKLIPTTMSEKKISGIKERILNTLLKGKLIKFNSIQTINLLTDLEFEQIVNVLKMIGQFVYESKMDSIIFFMEENTLYYTSKSVDKNILIKIN